ncbi:MAG: ParB/RepB/Spo0J family partition protein [Ignavibacteria bacterium]|jgi:ParB family chromosome partitioning protein|nr:ParB/RepB/Spo0J family partition protein [Ignavibacteria bacterium]
MSKMKQVMGRGLDALIKPQNSDYPEVEVNHAPKISTNSKVGVESISKLPLKVISPNPFQPRQTFEPEALEELKKSILSNGLIQPITVRKISENTYQLISGERRLRACAEIGYSEIPAYILEVVSDELMLAMALIENIQREKLNAIEVGMAYKRLMDECNLTQDQIAERVGKDRSTVANSIRLLKLPQEIQSALIKEEISMGHARALINLPSSALQIFALERIKEGNLNVRKVELLVKKLLTERNSNIKKSSNTKSPSVSANALDIEDKLRRLFGTKVMCKIKPGGAGEVVIEYYSLDELERLIEMFEIIENHRN